MGGTFYESGRGGLQNSDKKAAKWYRKAAEQGNPYAQCRLGIFIETGRGGLLVNNVEDELREVHNVEAEKWYRKAPEAEKWSQGNLDALRRLGNFYETGRGGLQVNKMEAEKLYRKADEWQAKMKTMYYPDP